jgi:hypothetical protein
MIAADSCLKKQPTPATRVAGAADGGLTPPRLVALCSLTLPARVPAAQ